MYKYGYLLLFIGLVGCGSDEKEKSADSDSIKRSTAIDTSSQYLDDIKLNGVIKAKDNLANITHYLGEPKTITGTDGKELTSPADSSTISYKGINFIMDHDTLILSSIDLKESTDIFLQTNKLKFSTATTVDDLKKYYPKFADELGGTDIDKRIAIAIPQKTTKDLWFFYFDRNTRKLMMIVYEMPD